MKNRAVYGKVHCAFFWMVRKKKTAFADFSANAVKYGIV